MPVNFKNEDLRVIKTKKALMTSLSNLLRTKNFTQITVNELCKEALISRTTFYLHFNDKYELLKHWLVNLKSFLIIDSNTYEDLEDNANDYINSNKRIIKNLTENANGETTELLCDFMFSLLGVDKPDSGQTDQNYIILSKFVSGGMMNYLTWQLKNKLPEEDIQMMNSFFYELLINLLKWYEIKSNFGGV